MAEAKRVALIPVKSPPANGKLSPKIDKKDEHAELLKTKDDEQKTIRLELCLSDSTEKTSPEYSYLQLVKDKLKVNVKPELCKKEDPFSADDSDQLKALAQKFENKYGPKPSSNKKRKHNASSLYLDIGYGYDESDPFVDNSEAYDELVPADWTTQHGGFYINQGELHYRLLSDDGNDFKSTKRRKLGENKKLKLKDGDKSLSRTPKELSTQKRKKQLLNKEKKQKKLENALMEKEKRQKKKLMMQSSKSPLSKTSKEKKAEKQIMIKSVAKDILQTSPSKLVYGGLPVSSAISSNMGSLCNPVIKMENVNIEKLESEGVLVSNEKLQARAQFVKDALANVAVEENPNNSSNLEEKLVGINEDTSQSVRELNKEGEPLGPPHLPENLPLILESGIQILKDAAANCPNGKCRFFDTSVNKTLLVVARALTNVPCKIRTTVYDNLAFYLPCSKETLVKRAKTLMIEEQGNRLDEVVGRLKEGIEKMMPEQKKLYDKAVANALTEQVREQMKQNGFPSKSETGTSEPQEGSHDKETNSSSEQPMTPTEEKGKKNMPKRKFTWNAELREMLCDVVAVKVKLFKMSKSRSMTAEEYVKDFLENDIRKLWPKGWMTSRILFKESKAAHQEITQPINKVKKISKKADQPLVAVAAAANSSSQTIPGYQSKKTVSGSLKTTSNVGNIGDKKSTAHMPTKAQPTAKPENSSSLQTKLASFPSVGRVQNKNEMSNIKSQITKTTALTVKGDIINSVGHKAGGKPTSAMNKKEMNKSNVTAVNPFERTSSTTGISTPVISLTDTRHLKDSLGNRNSKTTNLDQGVRSILDYAATSEGIMMHNVPDKFAHPRSHSKGDDNSTNAKQYLSSSSVDSFLHEKALKGDLDAASSIQGSLNAVWGQKSSLSHQPNHSNPYSPQLSYKVQVSKMIPSLSNPYSDTTPQQLVSTKHTSNKTSKPIQKTPPKEPLKNQAVTPPQSSPKTISPHRSGHSSSVETSPLSRTSPLVHFPSGIDHRRRLSGHSPEEKRLVPTAISHSVNRITKEASNKMPNFSASQQPDFSSMSFNSTLSSLSNALAASSQQAPVFPQGHEQLQKMAAMQQAKQITSTVDLLLQQEKQKHQVQQHFKQQAMLQQQQQPFPNISTSAGFGGQGSVRMGASLISPEVATLANQNVLSSTLNTFDPLLLYQGPSLSNSEHFPNPFTNYRPKFS